jgi:anti-sigma factor RsiW
VKGNMMNCETIREQIFEPTPSAEVTAHLSACAECARVWQAMQGTMALLDEWRQPEPSPFFDAKLRARLQQLKEEEALARQGWFAWLRKPAFGMPVWRPLTAAAMVIALVFGLNLMNPVSKGKVPPVLSAQGVSVTDDLAALDETQQAVDELELLDDIAAAHDRRAGVSASDQL